VPGRSALLLAARQFRPEGRLLVQHGMPVPPARDQPGIVQRCQVLGRRARGKAVAAGQGVRRCRLGERFKQGGPGPAEQASQRIRMPGRRRLP